MVWITPWKKKNRFGAKNKTEYAQNCNLQVFLMICHPFLCVYLHYSLNKFFIVDINKSRSICITFHNKFPKSLENLKWFIKLKHEKLTACNTKWMKLPLMHAPVAGSQAPPEQWLQSYGSRPVKFHFNKICTCFFSQMKIIVFRINCHFFWIFREVS